MADGFDMNDAGIVEGGGSPSPAPGAPSTEFSRRPAAAAAAQAQRHLHATAVAEEHLWTVQVVSVEAAHKQPIGTPFYYHTTSGASAWTDPVRAGQKSRIADLEVQLTAALDARPAVISQLKDERDCTYT